MKDRQKEPLWLNCQCHAHAMQVEAEDDQIFINLWTLGFEDRAPSFIDRIKTCWKVLTTGRVAFADVVLNLEDSQRLSKFLDDNAQHQSNRSTSHQVHGSSA